LQNLTPDPDLRAIAAAGRLHSQFGWPRELIGFQSKKNWAFDLVGYDSALVPLLVCDVKA